MLRQSQVGKVKMDGVKTQAGTTDADIHQVQQAADELSVLVNNLNEQIGSIKY